jgi:shikimate dehydrogenase
VARARELAANLPSWVSWVELRLDLLSPEDLAAREWVALPARTGRDWLATWRSPAEGGGSGELPEGLYAEALEHGFRWVDVEAERSSRHTTLLESVPAERRWVSAHLRDMPADLGAMHGAWERLTRHPAHVHKLVLPASGFEANDQVTALLDSLPPSDSYRAVFAQGWPGHPSRILDFWSGRSVVLVAPDDRSATGVGQPTLDRVGRVYGLPRLEAPTALFGVLGHPIRYSRSPEIHNHVFRTLGKRSLYLTLESPDPEPVVEWVRRGKLSGLSVTAPFKESIVSMVDELEEPARRIGALNTIWREGSRLRAANTDIEAATQLLTELGLRPGDSIAILGAGGSARAIAAGASEQGLTVTFFNRDPVRGLRSADVCGARYGGDLNAFEPRSFAALVNTTPVGSLEPIPDGLVSAAWDRTILIDIVYGPDATGWERLARERGLTFRGGLEFLTRQAGGALERWIGVRPSAPLLAEGLAR